MSTINGLRVKNLRSLGDTGEIPIKKLSLLVGRNSGGKSTFARVLPLLRQSTEVRKRSPVLWYGRLVDFGSFQDSVRDSDSKGEIQLSFRIELDRTKTSPRTIGLDADELSYDILASITLAAGKKASETTVSQLDITFEGIPCRLTFSEGKLQVIKVGDLSEFVNPAFHQRLSFNGLLPTIYAFKFRKVKVGDQDFNVPEPVNVFTGALTREITSITKVSEETGASIADKLTFGTDAEILAQLKAQSEPSQRWVNFCKSLDEKALGFQRIRNAILMARLPQLLTLIDETITLLAKNVSYLEPLRATAQRYYRRQELAVDEIDSRGENVPFFLDSLDSYVKDRLDKWLKKHFGISVTTESSGGHIAIRLHIDGAKKAVNLADTGFGYSQILPVALQLWSLTHGTTLRTANDIHDQKIIVIEQPELHLHPALQAKLADIFAACISDRENNYNFEQTDLRILVETHSPSLINRIGELVSIGVVDREDVQVVLFEKDETSGVTTTRISEFAADGRLQNWPYGFFDLVEDDDYETNWEEVE